jgi:flavin-dependent dehydrogenase
VETEELDDLLVHVPALVVQTLRGATCRLDYAGRGGACGADRVRLDAALLERAASSGAGVFLGATVKTVAPQGPTGASRLLVSRQGELERWGARLVIGADGPGSLVARAFGVQRHARRLRRAGLTFHLDVSGAGEEFRDGRVIIGPGWYCGICPVPGGRVNVGIVIGERQLRRALASGQRPVDIARRILGQLPEPWHELATRAATDDVAVALPLANRVSRRAGPGFLLVGDATGFIDPISGEGLHRALVSAELAAAAAVSALGDHGTPALDDYDRRLRQRFGRKDLISWLLQAFLARPEVLDYAVRRLGSRDPVRSTFAGVMADLAPAERALHSRFLLSLLRP